MDPEARELLNRSVALAEDNNKILHSIRRGMRISRFMSILYWVLIIGISVGAFYFLQPYVDQAMKMYQSVSATLKNFNQ